MARWGVPSDGWEIGCKPPMVQPAPSASVALLTTSTWPRATVVRMGAPGPDPTRSVTVIVSGSTPVAGGVASTWRGTLYAVPSESPPLGTECVTRPPAPHPVRPVLPVAPVAPPSPDRDREPSRTATRPVVPVERVIPVG